VKTYKLLVVDTAYTYKILKNRKIERIITAKDLNGFFSQVWTVHPVGTIFHCDTDSNKYGSPRFINLDQRNTFVEGKIGVHKFLRRMSALNFVISQIKLIKSLLSLVKEEKIDFIRAEDALYNGIFALILSMLSNRPLLIGVWGNPNVIRAETKKPIMSRIFKFIFLERFTERFVLRRCDIAMAQNLDNRKFLIDSGVPEVRAKVVRFGNLIDERHFCDPAIRDTWQQTSIALDRSVDIKILVLSRLERLKLVDHVLKALTKLPPNTVRFKVYFVGDGSLRGAMHQFVLDNNLSKHVEFVGDKDQGWIARALHEIDFVISPLTGRALAEVALAGKPVIAYDVDWHNELVKTGETGILVKYLDVNSLSEAIFQMMQNRSCFTSMGKKIRELALSLLDPTNNIESEKNIYESLIRNEKNFIHK